MDLKNFTNKIRPCGNLVAFKWIPPQSKGGIVLSQKCFDVAIRPGHVFVAEVLAVGQKVKNFTIGQRFLIHEYAIKSFYGHWESDKVYFTEEDQIPATVPNDYVGMIFRNNDKE